jgi:inner membrane protein
VLVLGHMGITLGAAVLLDSTLRKRHPFSYSATKEMEQTKPSLLSSIDLRLLLLGSLLPDIIDKPVGTLIFRDTFGNGRIFSHTLLFLVVITLAGFYLWRRYGKTWLLVLSFGIFLHLLLDQMYLDPRTFLWPVYGFTFRKTDVGDFTGRILHQLHADVAIWVPEIIGAAILIWFVLLLVRRGQVLAFARSGHV